MSDSSTTRRARRDGTAEGQRESTSTPHFLGGLYDEAELGELLLVGEVVALDRGREAALRRQAQLLDRHEARGIFDAPLEMIFVLELAPLGRHQAQGNHLAFGHEAQRL